jgi:putative tricarboxylic transport membrane protein
MLYRIIPLACAWLASSAVAAAAQEPDWRPGPKVEFVVPSGPGAALDAAARKLAQLLEEHRLAHTVVVYNKPGGANAIALNVLQQHDGDANYLMTLGTTLINSQASGQLHASYSDFTPLALLFDEYVTVAVRADSPIKTGRDLIARLRTDPTALSIGIATQIGNHIHLGIAKPLKAGGVDVSRLTVVPFKSSADSMSALLGGHLDVVSATTPNLLPHLAGNRIRVLAVAAPQRLQGAFAQIPTWREQGIDAVAQSSQGVMTTRGASPAQIRYWVAALKEITQTPAWRDFLSRNQWQPHFLPTQQATRYLDGELLEARKLMDQIGVKSQ